VFSPPAGLFEMIDKYPNWIGTLFRREVAEELGPLDASLKAIDHDYVLRAAGRFSFALSKKACAVFLQHPASYSGSHGLKLLNPGWEILMTKWGKEERLPEGVRERVVQKLRKDLERRLTINFLRSVERKDFTEAKSTATLFYNTSSNKGLCLFFRLSLTLCEKLPPMQKGVALLLKLRRRLVRKAYRL